MQIMAIISNNNHKSFDIKQFKFDEMSSETYIKRATNLQKSLYKRMNESSSEQIPGDKSMITSKAMELCNITFFIVVFLGVMIGIAKMAHSMQIS